MSRYEEPPQQYADGGDDHHQQHDDVQYHQQQEEVLPQVDFAQLLKEVEEAEESARSNLDFAEYEASSAIRAESRTHLEELLMLQQLTARLMQRSAASDGPAGSSVSVAGWYDALSPYFEMALTTGTTTTSSSNPGHKNTGGAAASHSPPHAASSKNSKRHLQW